MLLRTSLVLVATFSVTLSTASAQDKDKSLKVEKAPAASSGSKDKSRSAADKSKKKAAPAEAPTTTLPPAEEFAELYRQFKELINRLNQLRQKHADPNADKKAIEQEFNSKLEQTMAMEERLGAAAEKAYLADPNKDRDQNDYLLARLNKLIASDDFEEAARLAKVLIEHRFKQKYFDAVAGLAFFGANDFENAEKHLKLAEEQGELGSAQRTLELIEKHDYKNLWKDEQRIRDAEAKAGDLPKVKIETSKGDMVIELFENQAPIATNNFVNLVEKKFYDGVKFHRVLPGFMAQGGDPKGDGSGGPGYNIPDEYQQANHRNHFRGSLSMARTSDKDSGGSQFFICFQPVDHLDGNYTVFGRVVEGFDVLAKLQRCQPGDSNTPDKITRAAVISKRDHKYEPKVKLPEKK